MRSLLIFFAGLVIVVACGCDRHRLISDRQYLSLVEKSFHERKELAVNRDSALFSVLDQNLSKNQRDAVKFLYAFMPLSDLADYNGDFFLANIDVALQSRIETQWGNDIPDEIFLHYILPCRINNENLDSFRIIYYDEILNRVRDKDIKEAALEINHWCHEKVSYQPADIRTSAPMSTILSARGRCGEESTFTVAALRTVGIPARQVYTPRWAHSDDNHAWVEIWIDGEWYYMGACEPEPVLDQGWFTEPARRAMLVHTKSFGAPLGNENSIVAHRNYAVVNNLSKYAVTKKISVKVLAANGDPLNNASVEYQLYNYAEFYPISMVPTNEDGLSQFETGLGDLLVWAYKNNNFNFRKISVVETDTVTLKLNREAEGDFSFDLDLDVPVMRSPLSIKSPELVEQNSKRINSENIIRQKYIDSWMDSEETKSLARKLNLDEGKIMKIIERSMGNYNEIRSFLSNIPDSLRNMAITMLEVLSDKDLRDIKESTVSDHLKHCQKPAELSDEKGSAMYENYILNPRIANEIVAAWRGYLKRELPSQLIENAGSEPSLVSQYINDNIRIENDENYYKTPLTPIGVNELKVTDAASRSVFFVAVCRTLGIPSRLEPGSNVPQYFFNNKWNNVYFADQISPQKNNGYLKLVSNDSNPVPEYYTHFTIAQFGNGRYNTLEYEYNRKITDFKEELELPPGNYIIVTGNRLNDSKILSNITFFDLNENDHKTIEVNIRRDIPTRKISGTIDLQNIINLFDSGNIPGEKIMEKGIVVCWIDPEKEPTKHIFNDLPSLKPELDSWGGYFLFLSGSVDDTIGFEPEELTGLPANSIFGIDSQMTLLETIKSSDKLPEISLPYIIVADKNSNILFSSAGYRIGIGEQILKSVR